MYLLFSILCCVFLLLLLLFLFTLFFLRILLHCLSVRMSDLIFGCVCLYVFTCFGICFRHRGVHKYCICMCVAFVVCSLSILPKFLGCLQSKITFAISCGKALFRIFPFISSVLVN